MPCAQVCVCTDPNVKIQRVVLSLRQLRTWSPGTSCLSAGVGPEPPAPAGGARCCFIYLRTQVTFPGERQEETEMCLWALSDSLSCHSAPQSDLDLHKLKTRPWRTDPTTTLGKKKSDTVSEFKFPPEMTAFDSTQRREAGVGLTAADGYLFNVVETHTHTRTHSSCQMLW